MMISDQWEGIGIHEAGLFGKRQPQKECQVKQRTWNYDLKIKKIIWNYDLQNQSPLVMMIFDHHENASVFMKRFIWIQHGGLYRWKGNSFPFFVHQKLKDILIRYSRIILPTERLNWLSGNSEGSSRISK